MSVDYNVVCVPCKVHRHLDQEFSCGWAFGFGSKDEEGRSAAVEFILEHNSEGRMIETLWLLVGISLVDTVFGILRFYQVQQVLEDTRTTNALIRDKVQSHLNRE